MDSVRLPREYTLRQTGTRGRLDITLLLVGKTRHALVTQTDG